ncbi:MAG: hypothetical protein HZB47_10005 [Nitrosomonadales bacterium]|nr:hypothetical protein [Nitrosomonadales bacterium]
MRFKTTLMVALITPVFLAGCFGSGGSSNVGGTDYDGNWPNVAFVNPDVVDPAPGTNQTMICSQPPVAMTIVNGYGSTMQLRSCQAYTTGTSTPVGVQQNFYYLISVSILPGNIVNAEVNGLPLTGKCLSPVGCYAVAGTAGLTLTR